MSETDEIIGATLPRLKMPWWAVAKPFCPDCLASSDFPHANHCPHAEE